MTKRPVGRESGDSDSVGFAGRLLGEWLTSGGESRVSGGGEGGPQCSSCGFEFEAGRDELWIFSALRTSFRTSAAPDLAWSDRLRLSGSGYHAGVFVSDEDFSLGIEGGYAKNSWWNHRVAGNGVFANERLDADCAWAAADIKRYPFGWTMVSASLGAAGYSVDSRIDTNAPSFEYEGLSGIRFIGLFGLGAGLTTPRRFRLTASVEGVYYFPLSNESRPLEYGLARLSANLKYRF